MKLSKRCLWQYCKCVWSIQKNW